MPISTALPNVRLPSSGERQRARVGVAAAFVANGLLIGSWAPRIPEIKAHLGLSAGALGIALLAPALGTVLSARIVGARNARHGSAAATRLFGVAYCLLAWLPGAAANLATLWLTLLLWGAAMGAMDVSMNSQGVTVEGEYGRPVLSSFHATWSIGSFVGALLGGIGAALRVPVAGQQAALGAALAVAVLVASRSFLSDPAHPPPARTGAMRLPRMPEPRLVLLGLSAIFALMAEGAVADWSGVLLRDHLHVGGGQVGLGYAAFCVTMTAGRLGGDRVVHALGRARCLATLTLVGTVGLSAGMATNVLAGTVAGFALLGFGLSIMVPVLFSTAADSDRPAGPAIAAVAALGCAGMLVGPSLIGLVAQLTSVASALYLLPPFTLAAGLLGIAGVRLSARNHG
ncbi:MAG: MFS transporter [Pseudonocardiales bacterium]|nr:MAG: MFS transporter [Pseudonocardiales bacterium]